MYKIYDFDPPEAKQFKEEEAVLYKELHAEFVMKGFNGFPKGMASLDSGQPWFLYWLTNALEILNVSNQQLSDDMKHRCVKYLSQCQSKEEGGFAGAPYLQSHLASTYAAVLALVNIGTTEAYDIIDKEKMKKFLLSIKNNNLSIAGESCAWFQRDSKGEFISRTRTSEVVATLPGSVEIHRNGEMDMRGVYCGLVVADILNLIEGNTDFTQGMGDFIASCQTYEGGITCAPFGEAHGGYTFCGLAALLILGESDKLDMGRLIEWLCNRQLVEEGGFNGRINKLVDSCYNFWQGASFELFDIATHGNGNINGEWLFNQEALQGYTILCCQEGTGGLKDKPLKRPDMYHTCYSLAGQSIAQHKSDYKNLHSNEKSDHSDTFDGIHKPEEKRHCLLSGLEQNTLRRVNPIFNVRFDLLANAKAYFRQKK